MLPTERSHPKAGNENDRRDIHRKKPFDGASRSPGNSRMSGGRKLNAARLLMSSGLCL